MPCHYHVVVNTPGYLPEGEPSYCATWSDAVESVRWSLDDILGSQEGDDPDPWEVISGTPEEGFVRLGRKGEHCLGLVIDAIPCSDNDCKEED